MYIHVSFVPYLNKVGEIKTKPTQHSVKELRSLGIQPDVLVCRSEKPLARDIKDKLALFCTVSNECVVHNPDCGSIYEVPIVLHQEKLDEIVCKRLGLPLNECNMEGWNEIVRRQYEQCAQSECVKIAIVGKYVELHDAYLSIVEAPVSYTHLPSAMDKVRRLKEMIGSRSIDTVSYTHLGEL